MRPQRLVKASLVACLVAAGVMLAGPTGLAGQGKGGGGGHTEAAVNNLSYPALLVGGVGSGPVPLAATSHVLGKTYSYGCDKPELVGTFSYPNTSCVAQVGELTTYLDAAQCTAEGAACYGYQVNRIYWQKVATSFWKAETTTGSPGVGADFLDWGDNLESKSWTTTSTIRVETTPFEDHTAAYLKRGYQMWHVSGQGTDEQWGLRVLEDPATGEPAAAYAYDSQYSIVYTGNARLNITKLSADASTCPTSHVASPYSGAWVNGGWVGTCQLKDVGYTAELNVGGKYVYGYNWAIRRDTLPQCNGQVWNLAGWWRLTFYTPAGDVLFPNPAIPLMPPTLPTPEPLTATSLAAVMAAATEEGDTGPLYVPVVDSLNHLTYIDICIKSGGGGGGRK